MMKKIIVLSPGLSLPRYIKRINSFVNAGYEVSIFGFERGKFQSIDKYPRNVIVTNLGTLEDGKSYVGNLIRMFQKQLPIIKKHNKENVIYYSFGFVQSLLLYLFAEKPYIYEISDLVYGTFKNKVVSYIIQSIDKTIIRKSRLTIMTSRGFKEYLFPNTHRNNIIIQPNKMDISFQSSKRSFKYINQNIVFGFVGYIRYPNTIFKIATTIGEKYTRFKFYCYGDSIYRDDAIRLANKYNNVHFFGKYQNPADLSKIYNSIDVVVSCYDTTTINERVAEPNKLYESIFFCKPIVVSSNTFLAKRVKELNCGLELDATNENNIISFLDNISLDRLNGIIDNEIHLEESEYIDNPLNIVNQIKII